MADPRPIRVGVSACLLGEAVRYDGGHKRNAFLTDTFGQFVEWVPVCPEVECGLGTPREPIRLTLVNKSIRLLTVRTGRDLTDGMDAYATNRVAQLASEDLSGYVLKKDSPSCGMNVKVYDPRDVPTTYGRGRFAAALVERFPHLPVEEEGRLSDPRLRDNFVERVFAYWRLATLFRGRWSVGGLVRFHTAHKLILMAHSPDAYRTIGRLVARAGTLSRADVEQRYTEAFMRALSALATRRRHVNVLQHMLGYFKNRLDRESRAELLGAIEEYRRERVPLIVPITLMRRYIRRRRVSYLAGQVYLEPYPKDLMLRTDF